MHCGPNSTIKGGKERLAQKFIFQTVFKLTNIFFLIYFNIKKVLFRSIFPDVFEYFINVSVEDKQENSVI